MMALPSDFDQILRRGPLNGDVVQGLAELRYKILLDGIPSNGDGMSELRIYIWLVLLNAAPLQTDVYLELVRQGASPAYSKIRNDTFRTLATDPLFRRRVTENSLTRVLNAVAWRLHDAHEARVNGWLSPPTLAPGPEPLLSSPTTSAAADGGGAAATAAAFENSRSSIATVDSDSRAGGGKDNYVGYVQGMNVLAAPFLYAARSEVQAFVAFETFLRAECPGYIRGSMEGVHRGLKLVDEVLHICDPKLFAHLAGKGLHASIYAFPSVLTLCACTPPLPEVLQLWDFLFAYGMHLNILCIVAQLVLIRDQILAADSPNQVLRSFPPLQARKIKAIAISFVNKLPDELYDHLINHAK